MKDELKYWYITRKYVLMNTVTVEARNRELAKIEGQKLIEAGKGKSWPNTTITAQPSNYPPSAEDL